MVISGGLGITTCRVRICSEVIVIRAVVPLISAIVTIAETRNRKIADAAAGPTAVMARPQRP